MKRFLKIPVFLFKLIIALILGYLLTALLLSLFRTHPAPVDCDQRATVYVTSNEVHLFLVLPAPLIDPALSGGLAMLPSDRFIAFGWGDRNFYRTTPTWNDLKAGTALRALFLKSPAAMHVIGYREVNTLWKKVEVCPVQLQALNDFLKQSFQWNTEGDLLPIQGYGYSSRDRFFEATGAYSCFYNSNVWVNEALKEAEVPTAVWSPFDKGVLWHLE